MDNFTHSLTGWALGQTGLKRKTRKGLAALILGANLPDIDVFFGWVPWEPLATHRGVTHSLVGGVLILPALLAFLLWLLDRWQVRRGAAFRSGLDMRIGWLVALSYLGALTHPLLDWQNTYAVQLLSPFSNKWFHNDSLFIIDVWVWTGLAFAIWLSRRRERQARGHWRRPAIIALAAFAAYVGGNSMISMLAKDAARIGPPYAAPDVIFASPKPVISYRRRLVWRDAGEIAYGEFNPLRSLTTLQNFDAPQPDNMDDPLARRAMRANADVRDFMNWSVLPTADIARGRCEARIRLGDARFSRRDMPGWLKDSSEKSGEREEEGGSIPSGMTVYLPIEGTDCPPASQ